MADKKTWHRWIPWLMLSITEVILISQVPRVLTHTSNPDLHSVLYLHRSEQYWLFMTAYFSAVFVSAVLWLQLLTNKSTHWFARPLGHLLLTHRSFSWGEVVVVALMTLPVASIPEVAARALFIKRYGAPKTVLLPYWERFDRNMAMFGFTKRKDHLARATLSRSDKLVFLSAICWFHVAARF